MTFPQGILHILHVLKNVKGQYGVQAVILKRQFLPLCHAIICGDVLQGCKLLCSIYEHLLDINARKKVELVSLKPSHASPASETTEIECRFALQERRKIHSKILVPGIGQLGPVFALG